MIEVGEEYFRAIRKLVDTPSYNLCNSMNHSNDVFGMNSFVDLGIDEKITKKIHEDGFSLVKINNSKELDFQGLERWLSKNFGSIIKSKNPKNLSHAEVKAESNGKFYVNTHFSQPMHTDEGHTSAFPRYIALLCLKKAFSGGVTTLVSLNPLMKHLQEKFDLSTDALYRTDAIKVLNYLKIEEKPMLLRLNDNSIGISYSPILKKMWCEKIVFEIFDEITKYVHDIKNQYRFVLDEGQIMIIDNCKVLHGRTSFAPASERLLYRYWLKEEI